MTSFNIPQPGLPPGQVTSFGMPQPGLQAWADTARVGMMDKPGNGAATFNPLGGPPITLMVDASGIKSAARKRKCVLFDIEPHMYIDNPKSAKSATIEDVISANMSLLENMLSLGFPVHPLAKHIRFLSDKSKTFNGSSLIRYDLAMREKAELWGPQVFCYGDHELYHTYLGVESLKPKSKGSVSTSSGQSKTVRFKKGICWKFKSEGCKRESCRWKHECKECGGSHGFLECDSKK